MLGPKASPSFPTQKTAKAAADTGGIPQVASAPILSKRMSICLLVIITFLLLLWVHWGGKADEGEENLKKTKTANDQKPDYHQIDAQDAQKDEDGVAKPKDEAAEKIRQIQLKMNLEKLSQEEKLYRMRQGAPIEMYVGTPSVTSVSSVHTEASDTASLNDLNSPESTPNIHNTNSTPIPGGNLPLSVAQVEKLRRLIGLDQNMQFQQAVSSMPVETVDATHIQHLDYTITQGTLIPGSLQTAIDSDLPGMVKATVSMDVYAASGNRVLIPKGATLIGQYSSGIAMAQRRVLVVWTRLICPDGVDVMLGSPGTNSLGQAGLGADRLDTHFWTRFGQASLLSIIGAGIATAGVQSQDPYNSVAAYRSAIANNFQQTSNTALNATLAIKPTIHIDQGARITVFVNRDLSFYNALSTAH